VGVTKTPRLVWQTEGRFRKGRKEEISAPGFPPVNASVEGRAFYRLSIGAKEEVQNVGLNQGSEHSSWAFDIIRRCSVWRRHLLKLEP